jgi:hypothetical protein
LGLREEKIELYFTNTPFWFLVWTEYCRATGELSWWTFYFIPFLVGFHHASSLK